MPRLRQVLRGVKVERGKLGKAPKCLVTYHSNDPEKDAAKLA